MEERKKRRRLPRKCLKQLRAVELRKDPAFRRWRCQAPESLKRQVQEIIRQRLRQLRRQGARREMGGACQNEGKGLHIWRRGQSFTG
jgi:hypothetical protein